MLGTSRKSQIVIFLCAVIAVLIFAAFRRFPSERDGAISSGVTGATNLATKVTWSQPSLALFLSPGDSLVANITLSSDGSLENFTINAVPEIASYIQIEPPGSNSINLGSPLPTRLIITLPSTARVGTTVYGTVHINQGIRTIAKPLPISITVLPKPQKTEIIAGPAGVNIGLPHDGSFSLNPDMLNSKATFDIALLQKKDLPLSVPQFATIYAAIDLEATPVTPDPSTPVATASYEAQLNIPLTVQLSPGTALLVLTENRFKDNWIPTGDIATVSSSGLTASFSTKALGKLLLVNEKDLGQENEP